MIPGLNASLQTVTFSLLCGFRRIAWRARHTFSKRGAGQIELCPLTSMWHQYPNQYQQYQEFPSAVMVQDYLTSILEWELVDPTTHGRWHCSKCHLVV